MKKGLLLIIPVLAFAFYYSSNSEKVGDVEVVKSTSTGKEEKISQQEQREEVIVSNEEISKMESSSMPKNDQLFEKLDTGEIEKVTYLLDHGADIEARDVNGNTVLLKALDNGNLELAKILLERGANPLVKNKEGLSVATAAALQFEVDLFKKLVEKGAPANPGILGKMNLLMNLSMEGHSDMVSFILEKNPSDINLQDDFGNTALHYAVIGAHSEVVKALMEKDAEVSIVNGDGQSALDIAKKNDYAAILELLSP